ncbi:Hypothetical protein SMAX5B_002531 [Scophthalmus maximus]|uniref:Uncharacterized protein n=1 Tax=Scophthalmus maximus TaxID=52904 RepID=A0A2U9AWY5_SCOMX|nr:Hypothetical protein SMAX5B_002531 [Scophthalmus maximus]
MKINTDDYLDKEFEIEKTVPHVTLLVSEEYAQKHIGEMMTEAEEAVFAPATVDILERLEGIPTFQAENVMGTIIDEAKLQKQQRSRTSTVENQEEERVEEGCRSLAVSEGRPILLQPVEFRQQQGVKTFILYMGHNISRLPDWLFLDDLARIRR